LKRELWIVGILSVRNPSPCFFARDGCRGPDLSKAGIGVMNMLKRRVLFLALGLVAASVPVRAADNAATSPTLIVRVRSIDSVIADFKYLTSIAGRGDEARQLDGAIKKAFPNGFQGIDSKRPLGLYASLDADGNVQDSKGVLLLPVSDEKTFLGVLEKFNLKPI